MITSWFAQLERATSATQVLTVVRDYLATWTPEQLALLAQHCRPSGMRSVEDLECLQTALVEEYRTSHAAGLALDLLQQITSVVVRASIRLSDLAPESSGGPGGSQDDPGRSLAPRET